MTPSLEKWPTKAKEAPSPHEVRLAPLDTNPVFQCLRDKKIQSEKSERNRKKVDAKETFCYIIIFCAAQVVRSPQLRLNTIILTFSHSEHQ